MKKYIALGLLVGSFCTQMYGASREVRAGATLAGFLKKPRHESVKIEYNNQKVDSIVIFIEYLFGNLPRICFLHPYKEEVSREAANKAEAKFIQTRTVPALLYALMMGKHALPSGTVLHIHNQTWKVEEAPVGNEIRSIILQEKQ